MRWLRVGLISFLILGTEVGPVKPNPLFLPRSNMAVDGSPPMSGSLAHLITAWTPIMARKAAFSASEVVTKRLLNSEINSFARAEVPSIISR